MSQLSLSKALVADDHSLFRKGLAYALNDLLGIKTVVEVGALDQVLDEIAAGGDIDVVFLDLNMPGMAGMESVRAFVEGHPSVPVIIISAQEERELVLGALAAGARGYIPKSLDEDAIAHALQAIAAGDIYVPRSLAEAAPAASSDGKLTDAKGPLTLEGLTHRQRDVLAQLAKGQSNKEIARGLDIAEGTVKIHLAALLRVLGVRNRTEAAALAAKFDHDS